MTILDEIDGRTRWEYLLKLLKDSGVSIQALQDEQNVDVLFFAEQVFQLLAGKLFVVDDDSGDGHVSRHLSIEELALPVERTVPRIETYAVRFVSTTEKPAAAREYCPPPGHGRNGRNTDRSY